MRSRLAVCAGFLLTCVATAIIAAPVADSPIPLAGEWTFKLDPQNDGLKQKWFEAPLGGNARIKLPGTTDERKLGLPNTAEPSLADLYRPNVYEGPAWYQREIEIPADWRGKRVTLLLERCRWVTQVWIDGKPCGEPSAAAAKATADMQDSLISPHEHVLGVDLAPGKHQLTIRNDNTRRIDLGKFVSALYGGTPGNLNGIVGRIELAATDPVWIDDVQVHPDVRRKLARVVVMIGNATGQTGRGTLTAGTQIVEVEWNKTGGTVKMEVPMPDAKLWDEFSPNLTELTVTLRTPEPQTRTVHFGMRELSTRGTQFTMNGRPLFLRGTLECQVFPLTGHPPMDVPAWQRIYRIMKSYGLNHMRFHSWCPPDAAFTAADIEGIMIQAEAPQANVQAGIDADRDAFTGRELRRMIRTYGNHPSFCLMTLGNEYGGKDELLSSWVQILIDEDPRHLYSSAASAQKTANRQWTESPAGRGIHSQGTAHDISNVVASDGRPIIGHEIGQWVFYPNFEEMKKYTGVMEPRNFEIVRNSLKEKGMLDLAPLFVKATGKQAVLLYKEEIELLLRTPNYGGFSLLDLHDYPSQGTALIGLLDPFWDSKGFIKPSEHARYCGSIVPILRMPKREYITTETFAATADIAQFGPSDLTGAIPQWKISDDKDHELASGTGTAIDLPTGRLSPLCSISTPLAKVAAPRKLTVTVGLKGTGISNSWHIWVYPDESTPTPPADVVVCTSPGEAETALADGRKVLLLPATRYLGRSLGGSFLPTFWSPVWFPSQQPDTMSILCDPKHPLFRLFPTDFHSDWQWWNLTRNSRSMILDDTPADFRPVVQVIDNFARNHKLGNVLEASVGKGRLIVCSINITDNIESRPAARQFARSLHAYMGSERFRPQYKLEAGALRTLFGQSKYDITADSQHPDYPASNAVDGNPDTIWHTPWGNSPPPCPHQLVLDFKSERELKGLTIQPRKDNVNGRIVKFEIYTSNDLTSWGPPVAAGSWPNSAQHQTVKFKHPVKARCLRLVARSSVDGQPFVSVAEIEPLPAE